MDTRWDHRHHYSYHNRVTSSYTPIRVLRRPTYFFLRIGYKTLLIGRIHTCESGRHAGSQL